MKTKRFAFMASIAFFVGMASALLLGAVSARNNTPEKISRIASQDEIVNEITPTPIETSDNEAAPTSKPRNNTSQTDNSDGGQTCKINPDCNLETEYCAKVKCGDETGVCRTRPTSCANDFLVVCSCDGKNYSNECAARRSGANVARSGAC